MIPRHSPFLSAVLAAMLLVPATVSYAQDCALRLSALEEATGEFAAEVSVLGTSLARGFAVFASLDAQAAAAPEQCPSGIAQSRDAVIGLPSQDLVRDGDVLLNCGQFFGARVLADIDAAKDNNDSQLLIRLGEIQNRIFAVQQQATDAAIEATFLGLRTQRLIREHTALEERCNSLSDIYD